MCWDNPFVHTAAAFSRRHYDQVGGYQPACFEDYDLWSRLARVGTAKILDRVTAVHIKRPGSLSDIEKRHSLAARFAAQKAHWRRLPTMLRVATLPLLLPNLVRTRL
jgi:hypothetical protein